MSPSTTTVLPPGTKPSSASRPRRNESEGILPASFKTRFLSPVKRERKPTPGRGTPVSVRSSNLDISPTRSRSVIFFEPSISSALKAESWVSSAMDCRRRTRSEEHTSELQSLAYLVCRLLLEKKKKLLYSSQPR